MGDQSEPDGWDVGHELVAARAPQNDLEARRVRAHIQTSLFGAEPDPIKIDRYVVLGRVGVGGLGVVYAAYDPELDRRIAVKLLRPATRRGRGRGDRGRLIREAQALARVSHPNVIPVYDAGTFRSDVYIAMELVEGQTLQGWLRSKARGWREVLDVFGAAGRGLDAAHAVGVVHRDFKPANVLVGEDGRVRVLDFGLAKLVASPDSDPPEPATAEVAGGLPRSKDARLGTRLTHRGTAVGTPAYMAPEQHRGAEVDERTDLYSFCVALWEALYGQNPFEADSAEQYALQKLGGHVRSPEQGSHRSVPAWVSRAVRRGLAVDPASRPAGMVALLDELDNDPGRRRKRVVVGCAASVAVVGLLWSVWSVSAAAGDRCDATSELRGVWDATVRQDVEAAFVATKRPYARRSWNRASVILDHYTNDWLEQRRAICAAEGEVTAVLDQRVCLDTRLRDLAELTKLFASADEQVVERAVVAATSLRSVASCADAQGLADELPRDAVEREQTMAVDASLSRVAALRTAGKYPAAAAMANGALERAAELGYRRGELRALLQMGAAQGEQGDAKLGEATLLRAVSVAEELNDDERGIEARIDLAFLLSSGQARYQPALAWVEIAAGKLRGGGHAASPLLEGRLHDVRGQALSGLGRHEEALAAHLRSLEIHEAALDERDVRLATVLNSLGSTVMAQGKFEEATGYYERTYELFSEVLGPAHPHVAGALNNVALVSIKRGHHADGRRRLEAALEILRNALDPGHPDLALALNNLGSVLEKLHEYDRALATYREALEISEAALGLDHPRVAGCRNNIGMILHAQGDDDAALEHYRVAVASLERSQGPDHPSVSYPLHGMGDVHRAMGRPDEAVAVYRRALRIREQALGPDHPRVGVVLRDLGQAQLDKGEHAVAREHLERAVLIFEQAHSEPTDLARARFAAARALWNEGDERERARSFARLALAVLEKDPAQHVEAQRVREWLEGRAG